MVPQQSEENDQQLCTLLYDLHKALPSLKEHKDAVDSELLETTASAIITRLVSMPTSPPVNASHVVLLLVAAELSEWLEDCDSLFIPIQPCWLRSVTAQQPVDPLTPSPDAATHDPVMSSPGADVLAQLCAGLLGATGVCTTWQQSAG